MSLFRVGIALRHDPLDRHCAFDGIHDAATSKTARRGMRALSKVSWAAVDVVIHYGVGHGLLQERCGRGS